MVKQMINNPQQEVRKTGLLEELAALEHEQWKSWALDIIDTEKITKERVTRWFKLCVPYRELSEEDKYKDREWAEQVLWVIKKHMGIK